jgi:hypothetical protein
VQADQDPWSLGVEGDTLRSRGFGLELGHVSTARGTCGGRNAFVSMEGEAMLAAKAQPERIAVEGVPLLQ